MSGYNTEQKKILISYMTEHCKISLSIDEWIDSMRRDFDDRFIPGRSTFYRIIQKLVEDGKVIRTSSEGHGAKYQIAQCEALDHLHMKCLSCGKLIHLSHSVSDSLEKSLIKENFNIDKSKTVIYGKCSKCR